MGSSVVRKFNRQENKFSNGDKEVVSLFRRELRQEFELFEARIDERLEAIKKSQADNLAESENGLSCLTDQIEELRRETDKRMTQLDANLIVEEFDRRAADAKTISSWLQHTYSKARKIARLRVSRELFADVVAIVRLARVL
jgi:hypothetical protein